MLFPIKLCVTEVSKSSHYFFVLSVFEWRKPKCAAISTEARTKTVDLGNELEVRAFFLLSNHHNSSKLSSLDDISHPTKAISQFYILSNMSQEKLK